MNTSTTVAEAVEQSNEKHWSETAGMYQNEDQPAAPSDPCREPTKPEETPTPTTNLRNFASIGHFKGF